ncbi:MAG: hypothetical protein GTO45_32395 [Candidatus Aminicenantes bacterium]|nr:hypothetical protein [Candidatus Aminicenantes bacterium]NIM83451.1 hypothetical protein [Candidatus Aminicenantes bacterium]NIN22843.1 hypothetical protein [Candidatus Aminicenantes bacterium]NIN46579.1 hypothetical protein [Candidatus Aminicenantes bacterium]NIN89482.1 hypothetical protein [Candidatus Aminicenantes bacterium]
MKYFSVPADFKTETIDRYEILNNTYDDSRVIESYGNITVRNGFESGRSVEQLPEVDWYELENYIAYSKQKNIDFNYTINSSYMQNKEFTENGILKIKTFLKRLYEIGVDSLTVALPSLIELIKSTNYNFKIKASVICQITNANKAMSFKKMGAARMVVDESMNRNFKVLERIKNVFGDYVEIIVNPICFKDCIYRMFHYNQISGDSIEVSSQASIEYYPHRCVLKRYENTGNLLKLNWVRPEDINYYSNIGICHFKLQGRHTVLKGDPVRAVECYAKESYDGDLMELLDLFDPTTSFRVSIDNKKLDGFIKPYYENENFCKNDCSGCNYCESFAQKCIDHEKANEVIQLAVQFYNDYDRFKEMIAAINPAKVDNLSEEKMDIGFDL